MSFHPENLLLIEVIELLSVARLIWYCTSVSASEVIRAELVSTVSVPKITKGGLISALLGQVPGTTKFWLMMLNPKSRETAVRNGRADGTFPSNRR